ncbi:MAG: hypothetical protein Q8P34_16070, partial [Bacteroidota bacterium]|nr:hypothetical protein [Bacteroidota bacterium]
NQRRYNVKTTWQVKLVGKKILSAATALPFNHPNYESKLNYSIPRIAAISMVRSFFTLLFFHTRWLKPNGKGYNSIDSFADLCAILCHHIHVTDRKDTSIVGL